MEARSHHVFGSSEPQKLFQARVNVCGRFLLSPGEEFTAEKAEELAKRAVGDGAKVRTRLQVLTSGLRLGESGIFASMPLEFIRFQRVAAACASPGTRMLAVCTKDFEQKSVTVIRFKTSEALAEAGRLIDRQRRMAAEEANYLLDTPTGRGLNGSDNWAMATPARATSAANPHEARVTVTRAAASARATSSVATLEEDDVFSVEHGTRAAANPAAVVRNGSGGPQIDSVILNYDEMPGAAVTYAVFESNHGPPTMLNERVVVQSAATDQVDAAVVRPPAVGYVSSTSNGSSSAQRSNSLTQRLPQPPQVQYHQLQPQQSPQPRQQLVQLVPVRRKHVSLTQHQHRHQPQQQFALYPASRSSMSREYYYLMTK